MAKISRGERKHICHRENQAAVVSVKEDSWRLLFERLAGRTVGMPGAVARYQHRRRLSTF